MYYVNKQKIVMLLGYLPRLSELADRLQPKGGWNSSDPVAGAALERLIHLALEAVTDIGSLLIDGYLLRDASSYEDIVDILADAGAVSPDRQQYLLRLVRQRKGLVQEYWNHDQQPLLELAIPLAAELEAFGQEVRGFMERELAQ